MKPFSAFKFFVENKKKGVLTFVVIVLTVCAVSLITGLIRSIFDIVNEVDLKMFESISFVSPADALGGMPEAVTQKLKSDGDIKELLPVYDMGNTDFYMAIGGNTGIPVIFASPASEREYLSVTGDRVTQGRLPGDGAFELAVHWKVMNNRGWKLGQEIGSDVSDDENLNGRYKIVGVLDGPAVTVVGGASKNMAQYRKLGIDTGDNPLAYAVVPREGRREAVNAVLAGLNKKQAQIYTYDSMQKELQRDMGGMQSMLSLIVIVVVFILSLSMSALTYLVYAQRSEEFGILSAMGYRRSFIRGLILREVLSLNLVSWLIGLLGAVGMFALLNRLIYTAKGTPLALASADSVGYTLAIPLMVAVFSLLPILIKLRRQDAITVIERRD